MRPLSPGYKSNLRLHACLIICSCRCALASSLHASSLTPPPPKQPPKNSHGMPDFSPTTSRRRRSHLPTGTRRRHDGGSHLSSTRCRHCPYSRLTLSPHGSTARLRSPNPYDIPALSAPSDFTHAPSQAPLLEMAQGSSSLVPPDSNTLSTASQCFTGSRSVAATSCTPTNLSPQHRERPL